jgi:hypothetical protein
MCGSVQQVAARRLCAVAALDAWRANAAVVVTDGARDTLGVLPSVYQVLDGSMRVRLVRRGLAVP